MGSQSLPHSSPLSIAIIGAGIGGITLAIALSKRNPSLQLTLYESRSQFSEIGAGVGLGPNAVRAMGLIWPELPQAYEKVKAGNGWPEKDQVWFNIGCGDGSVKFHEKDAEHSDDCEGGSFEVRGDLHNFEGFVHGGASRAAFLDELIKLLPPQVVVKFGKKVVDVIESTEAQTAKDANQRMMQVSFADGSSITADAVIGCDGIRSACRRILVGEELKARFSGKYAYRKVVPMSAAVSIVGREIENRMIFVGKGGHILIFPIAEGKLLNMVVFRDAEGKEWTDHQWVIQSTREEVLKDFKGWNDTCVKLLEVRYG